MTLSGIDNTNGAWAPSAEMPGIIVEERSKKKRGLKFTNHGSEKSNSKTPRGRLLKTCGYLGLGLAAGIAFAMCDDNNGDTATIRSAEIATSLVPESASNITLDAVTVSTVVGRLQPVGTNLLPTQTLDNQTVAAPTNSLAIATSAAAQNTDAQESVNDFASFPVIDYTFTGNEGPTPVSSVALAFCPDVSQQAVFDYLYSGWVTLNNGANPDDVVTGDIRKFNDCP